MDEEEEEMGKFELVEDAVDYMPAIRAAVKKANGDQNPDSFQNQVLTNDQSDALCIGDKKKKLFNLAVGILKGLGNDGLLSDLLEEHAQVAHAATATGELKRDLAMSVLTSVDNVPTALLEVAALLHKKGQDYNSDTSRDAYFPFGQTSIVQMVWIKTLRAMNLVKSGKAANFEGLRDTYMDNISYSLFGIEHLDKNGGIK